MKLLETTYLPPQTSLEVRGTMHAGGSPSFLAGDAATLTFNAALSSCLSEKNTFFEWTMLGFQGEGAYILHTQLKTPDARTVAEVRAAALALIAQCLAAGQTFTITEIYVTFALPNPQGVAAGDSTLTAGSGGDDSAGGGGLFSGIAAALGVSESTAMLITVGGGLAVFMMMKK